jgi:hypothetical protein
MKVVVTLIQQAMQVIGLNNSMIICAALLYLCSTSCKSVSEADNEPFTEISGKSIAISGNIDDASILTANEQYIYFTHRSSSPMLSKFLQHDDSITLCDKFISMGNGPYEVQTLLANSISPNGNDFFFSDPILDKIICYNDLTDSITVHKFIRDGERIKMFRFAVGHPSGTLITYVDNSGKNADGIVGLVSATDSAFTPIKGIGTDMMKDLPIGSQFYHSPNCLIFVQPKEEKCLFVSCVGQYAEVFEIDGAQAKDKKILINNVPPYSIDERGHLITDSDDLTFGLMVSVTSDRIYLAPRRVTHLDDKTDGIKNNPKFAGIAQGPNFVDEIWEFDWDGNQLNKYKLNSGVSSFQVSPTHILWATSEDNNYDTTILRYDLSE